MLDRFRFLILCGALTVASPARAQTTSAAEEVLTNKSVISMVSAKLSDDLIIAKIQGSKTRFDLTTSGMVALSNAGVSSSVMRVMMGPPPTAVARAEEKQPAPSSGAPGGGAVMDGDLSLPNEAGIYMLAGDSAGAGKTLTGLEPTTYSQGKTGGWLGSAVTGGIAKRKFKAVLSNPHAAIRTADPKPTFYFVFETTNAGLSNNSGFFTATTSPNEFTLLHLDAKKETRETVIGSANAFGMQSGTDTKKTVPFSFTKLRPGVYRVVLDTPLQAGEYCFFSSAPSMGATMAGTQSANRVFDFSVSSGTAASAQGSD